MHDEKEALRERERECESVFWVFWVGGWLKRSSASDDNKTEDELDYG